MMCKLQANNDILYKIISLENKIKYFIIHNFDSVGYEELILFKEVLEVFNDIKK